MKRRFTRILAAFALLVFMAPSMVGWGQTVIESNFTDKDLSVGQNELTWSASPAFNSFESSNYARGAQSAKANTSITMTSGTITGVITKVVVTASTNGGSTKMSVKINGESFGSQVDVLNGTNYANKEYTFTGNKEVTNGTITITITRGNCTFWVKKTVVTYSAGAVPTPCTITFDAGSGTCDTETQTGNTGSTIILPTATPSQACQDAGWTFAGWAAASVSETTTAPTLLTSPYTINGDATLYAVYSVTEGYSSTTEFDFETIASENNWQNDTRYSPVEISPVTITASTNSGKYYTSDKTWRCYSGGNITITSTSANITEVTSNPNTSFTINPNGSASQSFSAATRFKSITVKCGSSTTTYATSPACLEKVATPVIALAAGTYSSAQTTTLTCETSGATIYYTTDGTDPTTSSNQYISAITVDHTMTLKAIAVKEGMDNSSIVTASYIISLPLTTMQAIYDDAVSNNAAHQVFITFNDWVVTGANDSQHAFLSDGTKGCIIFGTDHGFLAGNVLSGTVQCNIQLYNGSAEITELTSSTSGLTVATGGTVSVASIAMADLEAVNTGALVSYQNLICEERVEGDYTNYYLSDGTTEIQAYKTLLNDYADYLEDGKTYNITGVFVLNKETKRINPRSADDIVEVHTLTIPAFNGQNGGYRLISSPVATATNPTNPENVTNMITDDDDNNNRTYDLYRFDQAQELEWRNYRNNDGGHFNLEFGKGYLYGNLSEVELVFTGTAITSGTQNVTLYYTEGAEFAGWNLVGNPFGVEAYIDRPFYRMNTSGQINGTTETGRIGVMEGVFVIATSNEEMPFSTQPIVKKGSTLALDLSSSHTVLDRAIVRFDEGQQLPKFQLNKNHTKVYFTMDGKDYAIVRSEEMGELPVNFKAEDNGTYSLNFSCENVGFAYLHLIDNKTGNDVDLLKTPSYSFEAKTTDYESRFKLVFATGDNSNDDNFAFYSNGSFVINNPSTGSGPAELQVIDITGRIVKSESVNGCTNVNVNVAPGVYMLRLINGDNVKTQKVVVK